MSAQRITGGRGRYATDGLPEMGRHREPAPAPADGMLMAHTDLSSKLGPPGAGEAASSRLPPRAKEMHQETVLLLLVTINRTLVKKLGVPDERGSDLAAQASSGLPPLLVSVVSGP